MALSWEGTYQEQKKTALDEENMRKAGIGNWQAYQPRPATPPLS
jgi:hypothetical protein